METIINYLNNNKPFVAILVGPPLSGKSTFIKKLSEKIKFNVISRDQIVMDLSDSDDYNIAFNSVDQKMVDSILRNKLISSNLEGKNVVIDMTHLSSKRRKTNLNYFDDVFNKVAIVFPTISEDEYVKRNQKRRKEESKNIPLNLWKSMIDSFDVVRREEGFDKIIAI